MGNIQYQSTSLEELEQSETPVVETVEAQAEEAVDETIDESVAG